MEKESNFQHYCNCWWKNVCRKCVLINFVCDKYDRSHISFPIISILPRLPWQFPRVFSYWKEMRLVYNGDCATLKTYTYNAFTHCLYAHDGNIMKSIRLFPGDIMSSIPLLNLPLIFVYFLLQNKVRHLTWLHCLFS